MMCNWILKSKNAQNNVKLILCVNFLYIYLLTRLDISLTFDMLWLDLCGYIDKCWELDSLIIKKSAAMISYKEFAAGTYSKHKPVLTVL